MRRWTPITSWLRLPSICWAPTGCRSTCSAPMPAVSNECWSKTMAAAAEVCDVAVIGGGPAGSTAAILLARRSYKVIALEKARHPRFHIGESLLPMNLPVFERLGVLEKVRALGVQKLGADFQADNDRGYSTFAFSRAIGTSPPHSYQVWRQDFDKMLYDHARESGADAREGQEVRKG